MSWKLGIQDDALSVSPIKWNIPKKIIQYSFRINNLDANLSLLYPSMSQYCQAAELIFYFSLGSVILHTHTPPHLLEYKREVLGVGTERNPLASPLWLDDEAGRDAGLYTCFLLPSFSVSRQRTQLAVWTSQSSLHQQGLAWARQKKKNQVYFQPSGSPGSPWVW